MTAWPRNASSDPLGNIATLAPDCNGYLETTVNCRQARETSSALPELIREACRTTRSTAEEGAAYESVARSEVARLGAARQVIDYLSR
jgi:hypothetical protein